MAEIPNSQPKQNLSLLIPVLLVSVIIGGVSGGVVGYTVASRADQSTTLTNGTKAVSLSVEEESATVNVVRQTADAVVTVVATKDLSAVQTAPLSPFDDFFGFPFFQQPQNQGPTEVGQGAGFIVTTDGVIVTNKHVVDDDEAAYSVILADGTTYDASVLAKDPTNDVAFIKIEAAELPTLTLGDSDAVDVGQTVVAIGNPLKFRGSVTKGIISGRARTITASDGNGQAETLEDVFQTDAAINPGNSGGPLINLAGQVIGVNTAVSQEGQLIGFAIPSNVIKRDLASYQERGKIVRPLLGVRYVLITERYAEANELPVQQGAHLQAGENDDPAVLPDSPADAAGLQEGDIITEVNGEKITEDRSLAGLLSQYAPDETITLKYIRDDQAADVQVTLTEREE